MVVWQQRVLCATMDGNATISMMSLRMRSMMAVGSRLAPFASRICDAMRKYVG